MEYEVGKDYENKTDKEVRKKIGQYYTPAFIVKYIVAKSMEDINLIENPHISIIDISCGTGFFLLEAYDYLRGKFTENIELLREIYGNRNYYIENNSKIINLKGRDYWQEKNLHYHILTHCIYGADMDGLALEIAGDLLKNKDQESPIEKLNLVQCDSLIRWEEKDEPSLKKFWSKKYDLVIGNPPYIGHKQLGMDYKTYLLENYRQVFRDKSDISYCFFMRSNEILARQGRLALITSRYFMENPTGYNLRSYLLENYNLKEIIDFYGGDIFKGVGVATAIFFLSKSDIIDPHIRVRKLINDSYDFSQTKDLAKLIKSNIFEDFQIEKESLDPSRWVLISPEKISIFNKIEEKTSHRLGDLARTFQGIISGCDKAFVLKSGQEEDLNIEKDLLKKWIKNSHIKKYGLEESNLFLIYSDLIEDQDAYENSLKHIGAYRDRLENRREYKSGARKWYQLQWGRDKDLFERPKIIFPYKARENRFHLDKANNYFSADVYGLILKEEFEQSLSLEYLLGILNSRTYQFYFKLFGKKMARGIYDYYPNSVLDLKIPTNTIVADIEECVRNILKEGDNIFPGIDNKNNIDKYTYTIDDLIEAYFGFSQEEKKIINEKL